MNAGPLSFISLITSSDRRLVVPVYQRAYSWDEEQCVQLWEDILSVGRRENGHHFTGSVVWIQDGTIPATGVIPLLLIDGQQRVTTIMLLLVAMADYARSHKEKDLNYSYDEIIGSGYLINQYKGGDDRYKLQLSQGDRATLCSIIENLIDPDVHIDESSSRLLDNLNLFKQRLANLDDPKVVWRGIQRLEIVSISLTQGQDNPQLIFESMNSTGKDLSSADLIRNFVLMGLPMEEQEHLYINYWRLIEETLGADSYDTVFDDFIRNYLTVLYAPEPLVKRDVYPVFKRHVFNNGYDKNSNMVELLKEMQRFARYYAAITNGDEKDERLKKSFDNIAKLETSTLNPLLLSLYDDYEQEAFSHEDFLEMLRVLESYVFRRAVCNCASNAFNKFLPSIIARLNIIQEEGGNYREAFTAFLLNEAGTNRRFPNDSEFERELKTRDAYHFKKCFYMLSQIESSYHPKDTRDFASGGYTIEHILPQNALAHDQWIAMLGSNYKDDFDTYINNIGNLTLTAYNSELSDGTFKEKKERAEGGYNNEYITISKELREATKWGAVDIANRAETLVSRALDTWPLPKLKDDIKNKYLAEHKPSTLSRKIHLRELFNVGRIKPNDVLLSTSPKYPAQATITAAGMIEIANGETFANPSPAAKRIMELAGGRTSARNGWGFWKLKDNGLLLADLKETYLAETSDGSTTNLNLFQIMFWDEFYEFCESIPNFVGAFGDTSERMSNPTYWASFGIGIHNCHLEAQILSRDQLIMVEVYCDDVEAYKTLLTKRPVIDTALGDDAKLLRWDKEDADKKSRTITVRKPVDLEKDDRDEMFEWMADWLLRLKAALVEG